MCKTKKYNFIIKILAVLFLISLPFVCYHHKITHEKQKDFKNIAINKLKQFEGLRLKVYEFPKGCFVIGYGHRLKQNEKFIEITEQQADSLLISDLNQSISIIERNTKYRNNKSLALALISFNIGHNKVLKSSLLKKINANESIGKSWLSYCKYKHKGKTIISKHLKSRRVFEYWLFNNKNS